MTKATSPSVGYGQPPVASQFKPGRSGNPNGRPKKRASLREDLAAELDTLVPAGEGGQETMTCQRAVAMKLAHMARDGNMKALSLVAALMAQDPEEASTDELPAIDAEILSEYAERHGEVPFPAALPAPQFTNNGEKP